VSRCGWIERIGYEEYQCGITGVSVEPNCANATRCIPRMARMYMRGMLPRFDRLDVGTKEAIMQLTTRIGGAGASVREMSEEDLAALVEQVNAERQARAKGKRRLPAYNRRLRALVERRHNIDEQIKALHAAIAAIEEGRGCPEPVKKRRLSEAGRQAIAEGARKRMAARRAAREAESKK
jgi:hypothetical protein